MKDWNLPAFKKAAWVSAGIHPWYLSSDNLDMQTGWLESVIASDRRILAIGESGLDKVCDIPFDVQLKAFRTVISLSEKYRLPLVIHAVRSFNELIALKKETSPSQPWIVHGFRGKKELAESLLRQGFYLSLGEKFNVEAARAIPAERLLAETDESRLDISAIVDKLAEARGETSLELRTSLCLNAAQLFFSR